MDGLSDELIDEEQGLIQALAAAANENGSHHGRLSNLIEKHKRRFEELVETFFQSYHKWIPIVSPDSFQDYCSSTRTDVCRGLSALILGMILITRPLIDGGKPDPLRLSVYKALRRLFWDSESMAHPSLPVIQSGVLMSLYEYGQGMGDAAYITIGTCQSMAQVCGLNKPPQGQHFLPLPAPRAWTREDEALRTWWAILIQERYATSAMQASYALIVSRSLTSSLP